MRRWSDEAWEAALPVYEKILAHPFVGALADGSLPEERFRFYIRQDALYLDGYARRLAHVAARLPRKEQAERFLHFALDGIEVERALHAQFLEGSHPAPEEISPTCLLYTSVLDAQALAPVEVEAAAVLPCFVVYQRVGEWIHARAEGNGRRTADGQAADLATGSTTGSTTDNDTPTGPKAYRPLAENPYRAWIETYADPAFAASAEQATAICDELAAAAGEETRRRMSELFVRCTRMEWLFWESAWNLETWKI